MYRYLRRIPASFPKLLLSGLRCNEYEQANNLLATSLIPLAHALETVVSGGAWRGVHASRYLTVAAKSEEISSEIDLISFVRSAFDQAEGPYHCWLNRSNYSEGYLKKDGAYLLLADAFVDDPPGSWSDRIAILEKVKLLQQRYPWLHIFGFQSRASDSAIADHNQLINFIMEEYISFPILLCSKVFPEVAGGACCILSKGLQNPQLYNEKDVDLSILHEAIKDLNEHLVRSASNADKLKSSWSKQTEGFKEPYVCAYLRNLPLLHPACISADESGNRLFLSDSNHHRVIVFDSNGKILDAIGSSPGFEDGEFEIAKLMRPAASYYHASEDCLYVVDSENHAIRRADMGRRVLETLYPTCNDKGEGGLWTWILDKLGFRRDVLKSGELGQDSLLFPWHLLKLKDDGLLIMNKSFHTMWIMDLDSGAIRDVVKGRGNIIEFCGQQIIKKVSHLEHLSSDCLQQLIYRSPPFGGILYSAYMSSHVTFGENMLICDTVGQRVLMLKGQAEVASNVELSSFGILGLPYWLSCSLESAFHGSHVHDEAHYDHLQSFTLFPGRIDVHLTIDVPANTELVEPLQEHCVWRQTRGAAMEVLGVKETAAASEKVGVAQQWYDELDNLAFEVEQEVTKEETQTPCRDMQDGKIHIDCVVNTSPGTSEVIVSAPLYLKLRSTKTCEDNQENKAAKIAEILYPDSTSTRRTERDLLTSLLLTLNRDLGDLVFMKSLQVKITFDTLNHPKPENTRDIILTDSTVDVNVFL